MDFVGFELPDDGGAFFPVGEVSASKRVAELRCRAGLRRLGFFVEEFFPPSSGGSKEESPTLLPSNKGKW